MEPREVEKVIDAFFPRFPFPQRPTLRVRLPKELEDEVPLLGVEEVN